MDSKILESRLLLRESVIGPVISLSRCASKLPQLINNKQADAFIKGMFLSLFQDLLWDSSGYHAFIYVDILLYQVEMQKIARSVEVCADEIKEYKEIENRINQRILDTEDTISSLESDLKCEKFIRKHKELLEALASDVNTKRSRRSLNEEIVATENTLITIESSLALANQHIALRRSQYDDLLKDIDILQSSIIDEDDLVVPETFRNEADNEDIDLDDDDNINAGSNRRASLISFETNLDSANQDYAEEVDVNDDVNEGNDDVNAGNDDVNEMEDVMQISNSNDSLNIDDNENCEDQLVPQDNTDTME